MNLALLVALSVGSCCLIACGGSRPVGLPFARPISSQGVPVSNPVVAPAEIDPEPLRLYPVVRIFSLIEVVATTEGAIELRVGNDPGGGLKGTFSYLPLVNGVPDLAQETKELGHLDTTDGFIELAGKRPNLLCHVVSGFRSGPDDWYVILG